VPKRGVEALLTVLGLGSKTACGEGVVLLVEGGQALLFEAALRGMLADGAVELFGKP
jgi:hypothetical protein